MSVISEKYQSGLFPLSDDWQDDVRSSLYFQIWCSWVSDSGLVVWSPGNDSDDLGSIPGRVKFLKFQILIPLIFSHVQGYIYTHLDWNYHNHHSLVALCQSIELMVKSSIPVKVRMSWEVLWGYWELLIWLVQSEETKALVGGEVRMTVDFPPGYIVT